MKSTRRWIVMGIVAAVMLMAPNGRSAEPEHAGRPVRLKRPFFAFDNGMNRIKGTEQKATVLKELGYDGVGWRVGAEADKMIDALDRRGLKMISTYVGCTVDAEAPRYDMRLDAEIPLLRKHGTIIWLFLAKGKNPTDEIAVSLVREVAALARGVGLKVAIYHHVGFYVETVEDAIRIAEKVDRPNVGVSFNLCHFLKTDDGAHLEAVLRKAAPRLWLVSINGADGGDTKKMSWDRLIRPLGTGSFDVGKVLHVLDEIGYKGPIGLQCYGLKGDDRANLRQSIAGWKNLNAR